MMTALVATALVLAARADCPLLSAPVGGGLAVRSATGGGVDLGTTLRAGPVIRLADCEGIYPIASSNAAVTRYASLLGDGRGSVEHDDLEIEVCPAIGVGRTQHWGELVLVNTLAAGPVFWLRYAATGVGKESARSLAPAVGLGLETSAVLGSRTMGFGVALSGTWPDPAARILAVLAIHYDGLEP